MGKKIVSLGVRAQVKELIVNGRSVSHFFVQNIAPIHIAVGFLRIHHRYYKNNLSVRVGKIFPIYSDEQGNVGV
jgi:hypothetical protein